MMSRDPYTRIFKRLHVRSRDKIAEYLQLSRNIWGVANLKLFRNIGGIGNLQLPRNIYGIDYLKLSRKGYGIN